jgi:hypothetical protein
MTRTMQDKRRLFFGNRKKNVIVTISGTIVILALLELWIAAKTVLSALGLSSALLVLLAPIALLWRYPIAMFFVMIGYPNLTCKVNFLLFNRCFGKLPEPGLALGILVVTVPIIVSLVLPSTQIPLLQLQMPPWLDGSFVYAFGYRAGLVWHCCVCASCLILMDAAGFLLIRAYYQERFSWSTFCWFVLADVLCSPLLDWISIFYRVWPNEP